MRILIMGAGKMGTFFSDLLQPDNEVAVFDTDPARLRFTYGVLRFSDLTEVEEFEPEMVLNAVTVKNTIVAFNHILPHIQKECILSDIASVKTGLPEFYATCGHPFVSTHPMFGPTFASLSNLADENAIIISEGSDSGRDFFRQIYSSLHLNIVDYTFDEHDLTIAYSLSIPFASTLVFGSVMKHQDAPGTTFKRHLAIARGLMSEDDYLLSEILFNPNTPHQLRLIRDKLDELQQIVTDRDAKAMKRFLDTVRDNLE